MAMCHNECEDCPHAHPMSELETLSAEEILQRGLICEDETSPCSRCAVHRSDVLEDRAVDCFDFMRQLRPEAV